MLDKYAPADEMEMGKQNLEHARRTVGKANNLVARLGVAIGKRHFIISAHAEPARKHDEVGK